MGLFSSRKKKEDQDFILNKTLIEKSYTGLLQALQGELNPGSKDIKETVFRFADGTVTIFSSSGRVKAAVDSRLAFELETFLYWLPASDEERAALLERRADAVLDPFFMAGLDSDSSLTHWLQAALQANSWRALNALSSSMSETEQVTTEILSANEASAVDQLPSLVDGDLEELCGRLELRAEELKEVRNSLVGDKELSSVSIAKTAASLDESEEGVLANFVSAAAAGDSSLELLESYASGFDLLEVYNVLSSMSTAGLIELHGLNELTTDELPLIEPSDLNTGSTPLIVSSSFEADDAWDISQASEDEAEDAPSKPEESSEELEAPWLTSAELLPKIEETFAGSFSRDQALDIADSNVELEAELTSLEGAIEESRTSYEESSDEFSKTFFEEQGEALTSDDEGLVPEVDAEKLDTERENAHKSFESLESVEEQRYRLNSQLAENLRSLYSLTVGLDSAYTPELAAALEKRIVTVFTVENVAFHDPQEDASEEVDPALLVDTSDDGPKMVPDDQISSVFEDRVYTETSAIPLVDYTPESEWDEEREEHTMESEDSTEELEQLIEDFEEDSAVSIQDDIDKEIESRREESSETESEDLEVQPLDIHSQTSYSEEPLIVDEAEAVDLDAEKSVAKPDTLEAAPTYEEDEEIPVYSTIESEESERSTPLFYQVAKELGISSDNPILARK